MSLPQITKSKLKGKAGEQLASILFTGLAEVFQISGHIDIGIDLYAETIEKISEDKYEPTGHKFLVQVKYQDETPRIKKSSIEYWFIQNYPVYVIWIKDKLPQTELSFENVVAAAKYIKKYPSLLDNQTNKTYKEFNLEELMYEVNLIYKNYKEGKKTSTEIIKSPKENKAKLENRDKLGSIKENKSIEELLKNTQFSLKINKNLTDFEKIRLFLFAIAQLYDKRIPSEIIGNHELHLLYTFKEKVNLTYAEVLLVARTLISDRYELKAGYFWIGFKNSFKNFEMILIYLIRSDFSEDVIVGAIDYLDKFWKNDYFQLINSPRQLNNNKVKIRILELLKKHPNSMSLTLCKTYLTDPSDDVSKKAVECYTYIITTINPHEAIDILFDENKYDKYSINSDIYEKLGESDLRRLITHKDNDIKTRAFDKLIENKLLKETELVSYISDTDWDIRFLSLRELIRAKKNFSAPQIRQILHDDNPMWNYFRRRFSFFEIEDLTVEAYLKEKSEDLEKKLFWDIYGYEIYTALFLKNTSRINLVRKDLLDSFISTRLRLIKIEAQQNNQTQSLIETNLSKYDGLLKSLFIKQALKIILKHGDKTDIKIGYKYLHSNDYDHQSLSTDILFKYADNKDEQTLIDIGKKNKKFKFIIKALFFAKDKKLLINNLIQTNNYILVISSFAFALKNNITLDLKPIIKLLYDQNEEIRKTTAFYIGITNDVKTIEKILKDYYKEENYFYNVVSILDKLAYSPNFLKDKFKKYFTNDLFAKTF